MVHLEHDAATSALATAMREQRASRPRKARLTLRANGQHKHRVDLRDMTVQRQIAVRAVTDHQFALVAAGRSADQRIGFQHIDCRNDLVQACCDMCGLMALELVEDPLKILCNLRCQRDTRLAIGLVRAVGRFAGSPAMRFSRWPRMSSQAMVFPDATMPASRCSATSLPPLGDCRRGKEKARQDRAVSCAAITATLSACAPSTTP